MAQAKWYVSWLLVLVVGILAVLYAPSCFGRPVPQAHTIVPVFDKARAWKNLTAQVDAGYRIPGTETHRQVRDWLVQQLSAVSATVTTQPFSHRLGGKDVSMWNIIAEFPGTGTAPRERVLLCAHWDTRPTADKDPNPDNRTLPIAGASDGASGVAVLLEIARQLKAHPIARDVTIVLFDGEDYGPSDEDMMLGAQYYADHLPAAKPDWGILLDMVGDKNLDIYREPNSDYYAKSVNDRIFRAARELGYTECLEPSFFNKPYKYHITDDHIPLNKAGVPTADLIDFNYPSWHTLDDTPAQCSPESLEKVGKTVLYALQID